MMRRTVLSALLFSVVLAAVPATAAPATSDCPAEKICLWSQPNYTGKMIIQDGGRCQRPPAASQFGPVRSVKNRTTKKPDGGQWYLRMWTANDCNCSRTCAEQWDAEIRPGQEQSDLKPAKASYEAVFIEPDCPTC